MAFRPQQITLQGELYFPPASQHSTASPAATSSGKAHAILRGSTLHLHRGNPLLVTRMGAEDGAEVARIRLRDKGWTTARRRMEKDEPSVGRWAIELWQEVDETEAEAPRRSASVLRKRSMTALNESTNSFPGKLAARMKRGKSISGAAAFQHDGLVTSPPLRTEALLIHAPSLERAEAWVDVFNELFGGDSSFVHVSPGLSASASLPVALSSLSLGGPSSSSTTPSRQLPTASPFPLPPTFNAGRRPSWLDRPPPSNYRAPGAGSSSPGRTRSSSDVPAWIAATLAAHAQTEKLEALKEEKASKEVSAPLRMRRSMSLLPAATTPVIASVSMGRSQSDGRRSMEGGGRRLLGLLHGRRSSKKGPEDLHLPPSRTLEKPTSSPQPFYSTRVGSKSSTSLADSFFSESQSTSTTSDRPSTPSEQIHSATAFNPATPKADKTLSDAEQRTPRTFAEIFQSRPLRPSPSGLPPAQSRSTTPSSDTRSSRRKSRCQPSSGGHTDPLPFNAEQLRSESSREERANGGLERIVDPLDLISMMRKESARSPGLSPSFSSSTRLHSLSPPPPSLMGGLSPPPRSRSMLLGKSLPPATSSRPAAERQRMLRQQSFGAVNEGAGDGPA